LTYWSSSEHSNGLIKTNLRQIDRMKRSNQTTSTANKSFG